MQQVAGHVGAEIGRHVVNGHARPEFHALIGGACELCGTGLEYAEPL